MEHEEQTSGVKAEDRKGPGPPARSGSGRRRILRLLRGLGLLVGLVFVGTFLYACSSYRSMQREVASTPRDEVTGVVLEAEAIDLSPPPAAPAPTRACLLLHGFVGSSKDFVDLGERLAGEGLHVRMARLPGHGTTPGDFGWQTAETMLAGALEEFAALRGRYDEVYVIGFSMGGSLATLLAADHRVDRLVLVAPYYGVTYMWYYILPAEAWHGLLGWMIPYMRKSKAFIRLNREEAKAELFSYGHIPSKGVSTLIELGRRARRPETLAAVRCPTLMVGAEGDEAASPRRAKAAFERLASPRKEDLWLTRRSNHHLLLDYEREQAKQKIVEFLTGPAGGTSFARSRARPGAGS